MTGILKLFLISIVVMQLAACSTSPKSEADMYHDIRKGTVYKAYQKISIAALKPVVKEYDRKLANENKQESAAAHVHLTMSLLWAVMIYPELSLAEAEYALEQSSDPHNRYIALTLQSLALHEEGLHFLARDKSVEAQRLRDANNFSNRYTNLLVLIHVAGSSLAIYEGNITYALSELTYIGAATKKDWIVDLATASQESYNGAQGKAIAKLEKIKSDPDLSDTERDGIAKLIDITRAGGKDVGTNVAKAAVALVVSNTIKSSSVAKQSVDLLPEKYRNKLSGYFN